METIKDVGQASGPIVTGLILSQATFEVALTLIVIALLTSYTHNILRVKRHGKP